MIDRKSILIIDDSYANRSVLKKILENDYEIVEAEEGFSALLLLEEYKDNILGIILDLNMPIMDGYEFLTKIRESKEYNNIPVIVVTADDDIDIEKKVLQLGAWDYIKKPYDKDIVTYRLENAIHRSQLSALDELKYLTEYDSLTGIHNKSRFYELTSSMIRSNIDKRFVFIRFDIDRFQLINSFFGIDEGDKLLIYIAKQLENLLSEHPLYTLGRIQSDIFGICIFCNEEEVSDLINKCRFMLLIYNPEYDIVPTLGLYFIEDNYLPIETIYNRATLAAKKSKGNYVDYFSFYNDEMSKDLIKEQAITNDMIIALDEEQFDIYFQPKYNLQTNRPYGGEALVRWFHPDKGIISPGEFIPIFEKNGFIAKLDFYVWEKTCKYLRKWIDQGKNPYPVSVNVSRVDLYNPKIADIIIELVKKYDIPPVLLNLELTESAYTDNPTAMKEIMKKLQNNGFIIMMDDFGSGYSSLNVLKDISVDVLKVDMKFLSNTEIHGRGENILASVIRMAKWLKLPVIVEGVEFSEQVSFLKSIGCDFVQGFYFAKPMPVDEYDKLMEENKQVENNIGLAEPKYDLDVIFDSNPQMQMLFNNLLQAIVIYEFENNNIELLRANEGFFELFGADDMALRSSQPLMFVDEEYRQILVETFNEVTTNKRKSECEYIRTKNDGSSIWIKIKLQYVQKIGNKHIVFGILNDITVQKEVDFEISRYREALNDDSIHENRMLIVDDSEMNREIINEIFKDTYTIFQASDGEEALKVLDNNQTIDIILLDLIMPNMDGKEFLKVKKTNRAIANLPVIIFTVDDSVDSQVYSLSLGVNDYIIKPFVKEIVEKRVSNVMDSIKLMKEVIKKYDVAEKLSHIDQMTGLLNRITAETVITDFLRKNKIGGNALIIVDIDNCKRINDTYGHSYGDKVLKYIAKILKEVFNQGEIVSRIGGDSFLIFIKNATDKETISQKCSKICEELSQYFKGKTMEVSCSIGISCSPEDGIKYNILCEKADKALFEAKRQGKNQYVIYNNSLISTFSREMVQKEWFLDDMEENVFVRDIESYEIIFMSSKFIENVVPDRRNCCGEKCYKVFYNKENKCEFCNQDKLTYDKFYIWQYKDQNTGCKYLVKDKLIDWNGKAAHLQIVVDITSIDTFTR